MSVARNSLLVLAPRLLSLAAALVASVITARVLGPSGRGTLMVASLALGLLALLADIGFTNAVIHAVSRRILSLSQALGFAVVSSGIAGLTLLALALTAWPVLAASVLRNIPFAVFALSVAALPAALFISQWLGVKAAAGEFVSAARYQTFAAVAMPVVVFVVLVVARRGIVTLVGALTLLWVAPAVVLLVMTARKWGLAFRMPPGGVRAVLSYSARTYPANLFDYTTLRLDVFVLNAFAAIRQVGLYTMSVTMTETLWMVEASVRRASAPEVSSRGPEAAAGIVAASARSVLVIGGAAGVVLFAFAPQLIGLLYGPAFLGAVLPLRILLPGAILYGAARNLLQYHQFQLARPQVVSALSAAAALASIAAYLTLIPGHGVAGAALASALVYTSVFVVALALFCRRTGLSPAQVVIPTGADVRALGEMLRRRPPSSPPSTPVDAAAPAALDAAAAKDTQDTPDASAPDGVLVLTSSYPSAMAPYNGVFVREHSLALAEEGPCVTIVAPRIFREDPAYSHDGLLHVRRFGFLSGRRLLSEYRRVPVLRMATYVVSGLFSTLAVARARRPCVIQAHWIVPAGVIGVAAGKLLGVPVVITAHGSDVRMATDGPWPVRLLARRALINADHVIAVSQAIRQVLVTRLGVAPQRVAVVPMGVDQRLFKPGGRAAARLTLGVPAEAGVVLFVGALTQLKGVSELVEAMPSVVAASPEARLYVAGAGPLDDDVRRRTGELGLDGKVTLLGDVAHDEIARWMNAADVLVLPSRREGLPVCLMEAAAVGLPVVATDAGGSAEIVVLDPRSVLLPLAGPAGGADPSALAAAVESALLARQPDMRQPAFEPGSPYSLTGATRLITGIYEGLRGSRKVC